MNYVFQTSQSIFYKFLNNTSNTDTQLVQVDVYLK